jgi:hypothetical protein
MTRSFVRAFSVFYSARSRSPSFPSSLFSFVLHLASLHDTYMAICVRALAGKMNRARARDRRANERANGRLFFFLPIVYICTHTHTLLSFFLLFDDQCIGDIVFQACRRCPRRFTSIYYSFTNERTREKRRKKENVKQAIGRMREYESG